MEINCSDNDGKGKRLLGDQHTDRNPRNYRRLRAYDIHSSIFMEKCWPGAFSSLSSKAGMSIGEEDPLPGDSLTPAVLGASKYCPLGAAGVAARNVGEGRGSVSESLRKFGFRVAPALLLVESVNGNAGKGASGAGFSKGGGGSPRRGLFKS